MKILGISNNLGASASLVFNGKLICAIHEERLTRNKEYKGIPYKSINYILKKYKLNFKSFDIITYGVANYFENENEEKKILELKQKYKNKKIHKIINHRYKTEKLWISKHINEIKEYAKKNNLWIYTEFKTC